MQEKDFPEDPEKSFFFISFKKNYIKNRPKTSMQNLAPPDFLYLPHFLTSAEFPYI